LSERRLLGARLLRGRFWLYGVIVLVLLLFRVIPSLRPRTGILGPGFVSPSSSLVIAGIDNAPDLAPRLVAEYHRLYPKIGLRTKPGGTNRALEDLVNKKADVAFLSRPLTLKEHRIVRALGDSVLAFPVATAGILVLVARDSPVESVSVGDLRDLITGKRAARTGSDGAAVVRLYAPDPDLGLWPALLGQLSLPDSVPANVVWLASEREVAEAVVRDPSGLGLASTLTSPPADSAAWRTVRLVGKPGTAAVDPSLADIAAGDYPLYHYLYVACLQRGGALASGFVTLMQGEHGQVFIRRERFLPAREVAREIQLANRPVGMPR
jgi:ABC-type phosphate transport system substrate-binding protein